MCLIICICLGAICSLLEASGLNTAIAADGYKSELWLIDGVNYALINGERKALSKESDISPYQTDSGTMYLPLSIVCDYKSASYTVSGSSVMVSLSDGSIVKLTVGSTSWTFNGVKMTDFLIPVTEKGGVPFISILMAGDIFGTGSYYDKSMGLLVLAHGKVVGYSSSYSSLKSQISVINNIIMDRPTGEEVYNDLEAYTGSTTHPRLLIDKDGFDKLRSVYATGMRGDPYYDGIKNQLSGGTNTFDTYFSVNANGEVIWKDQAARTSVRQPYYIYDENGNRLVGETSYSYTDLKTGELITLGIKNGSGYGDGYDLGGRSNVGTFTEKMKKLAFSYQITGEKKYADAFYLFAKELDKWEHWGEGHFLNVADGSYAYAIGYDWVYHAFDDEPEKRRELADILYNKGMMKGYYSIKYDGVGSSIQRLCDFSVSKAAGASGAWRTINRTNNWQTVCGAGMIVSALAILEYDEYRDNCLYVIENYVKSFEKCLLQFAPDGSYPESPSYWAYCVDTLFNTLVAFENSCGRSYGYKDVVGLYESFYYAAGICDSDYYIWNYHDSSKSQLDASYFYLAANVYNDPCLAEFRNTMIFERGFTMSLMDVLFYDSGLDTTGREMPLDNNFTGIHTATFRSSHDSGSIYTGLHVGPVAHDHSDFDTGNFILRMGGVDWCGDPGTENYNVEGFWNSSEGGTRFKLYRKSLEGHSAVIIHSDELVHGQRYTTLNTDYPVINSFYSDENGGYAISDMTKQYGSTCTGAYRGVLLTNSRRTVILQDEISFSSPTTLTWVLNLIGGITISPDGRSLTSERWEDGKKTEIRLTLISDDESLRFRRLGSNETVLDDTVTQNNSGMSLACNPEPRVVIEASNVMEFNVAVVFDLLNHKDEAIGYSYVQMKEWTTSTDEWLDEANSGIVYPGDKPVYKYKASDFARANRDLAAADGDLLKIGKILSETAIYFTDYDKNNPTVIELVKEYDEYRNRYNYEISKINAEFMNAMSVASPVLEDED